MATIRGYQYLWACSKYGNDNWLPIFRDVLKIAIFMGVLTIATTTGELKNCNNNGLPIYLWALKMAIMGCQYLWAY